MAAPLILPKVKLKAVVVFPSNVIAGGGGGVEITVVNGVYQIGLDYSDYAPPADSIDPADQNVLVWNDETDSYTLVPISVLVGTSGIPEAPIDDIKYTRRNAAWVSTPNITVSNTAPASPAVDDVWIDTT